MTPAEAVVVGWALFAVLVVLLLLAAVRRPPAVRSQDVPRAPENSTEESAEERGTT